MSARARRRPDPRRTPETRARAKRLARWAAAVAVAAHVVPLISIGYAQEPESEETAEERITALERELASLETRFEARATRRGGLLSTDTDPGLSARLDQLEQRLGALVREVRRLEQQTAMALREAAQARRESAAAQRLARDAALR